MPPARLNRYAIVLTALLLPWFEPLLCWAQPPANPPPPSAASPPRTTPLPPPRRTPPPPPRTMPPPPPPRSTSPYAPRAAQEERPSEAPQRQTVPTGRPSQKTPLEISAAPTGEVVKLDHPPLQAGDLRFPINLAAALRLADARPLIVAAAQAGAWIAEGKLQKAKALWIPSLMFNVVYLRHDGPVDFNGGINVPQGTSAQGYNDPNSFGKPLNQNLNWFEAGGALYDVFAINDAIFQPLAARQELNSKRWDIQTAKNEALLETARNYFAVHKWRGTYAGALYCVEQGRKLLDKIERLSHDLVPRVEIDRARNLLAFLEESAVSARENWRVSSADLTQVLRLDPRAVVVPLEHDHLQITLIDPSRKLDELMPIGLMNRPELASQQAIIKQKAVQIRQEKTRPLLPLLLITGWQTPGGMIDQASIFGTGNGGKLNLWSFRDDVSFQLVWQLQNMGFGNAAQVKQRRGQQSKATAMLFHMQDAVVSEITQAQANMQSAAARVVQSERSLQTGLVTFQKNLEGLGQTRRFENTLELIYRPQEVVYALKLLKLAFDEYFGTVADYNTAQFQLFHALGYPARDIEFLRQPGNIAPVDTSRPIFLPPVGTGPPPPTR